MATSIIRARRLIVAGAVGGGALLPGLFSCSSSDPATGSGGSNTSGGAATSTGGSGAAGSAGTAGTANAGAAGSTANGGAGDGSVTQWGGDIAHTSHWVHASLTKANMTRLSLDTFTAPAGGAEYAGNFAGEIAAVPLYLAGATAGAGEYIAVTTQNDVYAFNEASGALAWKHNIGAFLGTAGSICGTPANHGIVSTPVIDAAARVIYVIGGMTDFHYEIHALSTDTGLEVAGGWPVNSSKFMAGTLPFTATPQSQRSALALVNGILYIAFGGYCGDQGNYHGWVEAVSTKDPTQLGGWATIERQAGIWAPGGMASDGNGVFAVTGNSGLSGDHSKSDSEEIIRVTGLGVGNRDAKNLFFPTEWETPMNSGDQDFGSSSPVVVTVPNSTPSTIVVAPSKPGRVYFLDAANLGASLGQFADMAIADTTASSLFTAPSAYVSASGVHVALATGKGSQCPSPVGANDGSVMSILLQPGATAAQAPTPKIAWCAKVGTDGTTVRRAPISTSSEGSSDSIVWMMNGSKLNGFDGETGAVVYDGGTGTCTGVHTFTELIAANGHLLTAGDAAGHAHLCSWSVHP